MVGQNISQIKDMKKIKYILSIIVVFVLTSCYTRYSSNLLQDRKSLPQYENAVYEDYKLRPNDELIIRILTSNEVIKTLFPQQTVSNNSVEGYKIYEDGTADFPYMPKISLAGKTVKEAEKLLQDKFKEFASDIQIKLALKTQTFCVIGEAGRGYFPIYKDRLTIYQGLALSGGILESGVFHKVKIIRTTSEGTVIKSFDIRTKSLIDSEFYYIQPNDIIYVDMSKKKFWASGSYTEFMGLITSSITFLVTAFSLSSGK